MKTKRILDPQRNELLAALAALDHMEDLAKRLHHDLWEKIVPHVSSYDPPEMMLYNLSREQAENAMRALNAGRWEKRLNPADSTEIDYTANIEGIIVQIYGVQPPPSCRIHEEEIEVPAHKAIKRTLVCK